MAVADKARRSSGPGRMLRRNIAAEHCGVSTGTFDKLVRERKLPPARLLGPVKVWDRHELDGFLDELPSAEADENEWDTLLGDPDAKSRT